MNVLHDSNNCYWAHFLLLLFLMLGIFSAPLILHSQSCTFNIRLDSQADVDAFVNLGTMPSVWEGSINIGPVSPQTATDITNLDALLGLTQVTGTLLIEKNPLLDDISGLSNLTTIGGGNCPFEELVIRENPLIPDFTSLGNLTGTIGNFFLQDAPLVPNLDPLSGITGADFLWIGGMTGLTEVDGFSGFTTLGDIFLTGNANLLNIDGLANVSGPFRVGQQSFISGNAALQNLNGLAGVTSANFLTIRFCDALTDLSGLDGLTQIFDELNVNNNDGLTSLNGLNPSLVIGDRLVIVANAQLSDCATAAVCNHLENNGSQNITANPVGCASATDVLSNCSSECGENETLTLTSQTEVDAFNTTYAGCSIFLGNIIIDEAPAAVPITNLNALSALREVNQLIIFNAPQLTTLSPLANLEFIHQDLNIQNTAIVRLDDLSSLQAVGQNLTIANNPDLEAITDFAAIASIGRGLTINNNPLLTDLSGFNNMVTIGDFLNLTSNASLTILSAFSNLQFAYDGLIIDNNDNLASLQGLEALENINSDLKIANNDLLTDISALTNLDQAALINGAMVGGRLVIDNNPLLANCAINTVCNLLVGAGVNINIIGNATTCEDELNLQIACAALLPVELLHFSATAIQGNVKLQWQTASENNNTGFNIERSINGRDWGKIGFVPGKGTTTQITAYQFVDEHPGAETVYYRLKQLDDDGNFSYSVLRQVSFTGALVLSLYPNPAKEVLYLSGLKMDVEVIISNQYGQQFRLPVIDSRVDISAFPMGVYYLNISDNNAVLPLRFVKW